MKHTQTRRTLSRLLLSTMGLGLAFGLLNNINADEPKSMTMDEPSHGAKLEGLSVATFAGGCFWCVESDLEKVEGVKEVISGYSGGVLKNPTYKQVSSGKTKHTESVQVFYDADVTSYEALLDTFFHHIDPTDAHGSFVDRGQQYRPAVFYQNDAERDATQKKINKLNDSGVYSKAIATEVTAFSAFYKAEDYHQDYYKRNPIRYKYYRHGSGRDQFIEKTWGKDTTPHNQDMPTKKVQDMTQYTKPSDEQLRQNLTKLQYKVTQKEGTEPAFDNAYWDNHDEGIYVDITTGEPLFSSNEKYESGTGWPSFWQPISSTRILEKKDYKMILPRTEVRSTSGNAHLGHVFNDGPAPTGLRYCLNSAALKFVAKKDLETNGYGQYTHLFDAH